MYAQSVNLSPYLYVSRALVPEPVDGPCDQLPVDPQPAVLGIDGIQGDGADPCSQSALRLLAGQFAGNEADRLTVRLRDEDNVRLVP